MISYAHSMHLGNHEDVDRVVVEAFGQSEAGNIATQNDDSFLLADMERSVLVTESNVPDADAPQFIDMHSQLFLVADGVGGPSGGRASRLAAACMLRQVAARFPTALRRRRLCETDVEQQMRQALQQSQQELRDVASKVPQLSRMSTTLTAAHLIWPTLCVAHIGDSRCYLLRGGKLQQLTTDYAESLQRLSIDKTRLSQLRRQASDHQGERAAAGTSSDLLSASPEVVTMRLRPDDAVILCTSGLSNHVSDEKICDAVLAARTPEEACQWLVQSAKNAGGLDNVTVVVVRVPAAGLPNGLSHLVELAPLPCLQTRSDALEGGLQ